MTAIILRRRKLGRTSAREIARLATEEIKVVRNWRELIPADSSVLFRWGCTSQLPGWVNGNLTVINTADSIGWCADKKQGRLDMQAAGVPVPKTWESWEQVPGNVGSVVFRPDRHAQGRNLYVLTQEAFLMANGEVHRLVRQFPSYYISELIDKVAEYRVFVCQNRVVWVAKKTPGNPEQVAWNVAQGGRFDNVRWGDWPMKVIDAALKAARVSGTDFCGVDVMVDAEGEPYVLEVNSAPSQTSPYRQHCVAKAFSYIIRNGKRPFDNCDADGWRSVIHPALREEE